MPTEEEEKRFEARVNERVAREAETIRKAEELRWKTDIENLRASNQALTAAQQKINEEKIAAVNAEVEGLKAGADPAVVDLLPEKLSPEDQRDWLKKALGKIPAPAPSKFPQTPKPSDKKIEKKHEPHQFPNPF